MRCGGLETGAALPGSRYSTPWRRPRPTAGQGRDRRRRWP